MKYISQTDSNSNAVTPPRLKANSITRLYGLFVTLIFCLVATHRTMAIAIMESGLASAGADLGASPNIFVPPSSFTANVFYEEVDIKQRSSGNTVNWHGWAGASWNVALGNGASRIIAAGSSHEGFNGAYSPGNGYIYGVGHAEVAVSFDLDRDYRAISHVTGATVSGITDGQTILRRGTHSIIGETIGSSGGFSVDVTISPARTFAVLVGSDDYRLGLGPPVLGTKDIDNIGQKLSGWATEVHRIAVSYDAQIDIYAEIKSKIDGILSRNQLDELDTLWFYYAGHGSGSSAGGVQAAINPTSLNALTPTELAQLLSDPRLAAAKKIVVLDSCHSGGFWDDVNGGLKNVPNLALLSATDVDGTTISVSDGTGQFSNSLLDKLDPGSTYEDLFDISQYESLIGSYGSLRDTGDGLATGITEAYFSDDFDVGALLIGASSNVPESVRPGLLLGAVFLFLSLLRHGPRRRSFWNSPSGT